MQRLFSFLLIVVVFLLVFVGYYHRIGALTQDLGRHLLTGNIILSTGAVPKTNLYSYTYPDFPFINHHYGAEVIFALLFPLGGYHGLLLLTVFCMLVAFGLVFWKAAKTSHILPLSALSLLYLRILFERTDIRPEIFSFVFLSVFITILFMYRERYTKLIFLLLPLQLLWVNTHIYFPIGILVLALFLIDEIIRKRVSLKNRQTGTLIGVLAAALLLLPVNPNGINQALYPLKVFENYGYMIEENQNPFFLQSLGFSKPAFLYLQISIVALFLSLLLTVKKARAIDWLLSIVFTIIALMAVRNFPLFVFATFIPASRALFLLLQRFVPAMFAPSRLFYTLAIIILIAGGYQIQTVATMKGFGYSLDPGATKAVDFYLEQKLQGPIFNNFDIGSYLESRLYPTEKVFVDGRPEAYPATFFKDVYIPMQQNPVIFAQQEKKYRFNTIFFSHTDQTPWAQTFLQSILANPSWRVVYLDPYVIILVKNTLQNKTLLDRFGRSGSELSFTTLDTTDLLSLYRAVSFYQKIGSPAASIPLLQTIIQKNPHDCAALSSLIVLLSQQNHPSAAIYAPTFQSYCR